MSKRQKLTNLADRLATKGEPTSMRADATPRQIKGKPAILFRLEADARKAIKLAAVERDMTMQDAVAEALNDWLEKCGKPPIV